MLSSESFTERVCEVRVVLGHQSGEPVLQITAGGGIRVLLNREAGGGVLHHHGAQPLSDPGVRYDVLDTVSKLE